MEMIKCQNCNGDNNKDRFFCGKCGRFLRVDLFSEMGMYEDEEQKIIRILENLEQIPHSKVVWDAIVDSYVKKVEKYKALLKLKEVQGENKIIPKIDAFISSCINPEFQIAFVGTIKTGKSTLINSLLGNNYASMDVTPETAALTKFRSSLKDYVKVSFYNKEEWNKLWKSRTSAADTFMAEWNSLNADAVKDKWIGHESVYKEVDNSEIKKELSIWSSSKSPEHYFVKEVEVGISRLSKELPSQVVIVDTPGLSDPVAYRSEIAKDYIKKANAVVVCVDCQRVNKEEVETISTVFAYSSHKKDSVYVVATHWDTLNDPEVDWVKQKDFMEKNLVGKAFFETKEDFQNNVMYSAAYINNLCREYTKLDNRDKRKVENFAYDLKMDYLNTENILDDMIEKTNIPTIKKKVIGEITDKYRKILRIDLENQYKDIMYQLKRMVKDTRSETKQVIETSYLDLKGIEEKVKQHNKEYAEISSCRGRLVATLKSVETITRNNVTETLLELRKRAAEGK